MQRPTIVVETPSVTDRYGCPTPSPVPPPLPDRLGDYELLERVGRGASAEVWLARRSLPRGGVKPCALKIIHHHIAAHPRHRRMFEQESRLALKMSHGNVVSVFDTGEASGRLFMALEWIDGVSLYGFCQRLRKREQQLTIGEVCYVLSQILQGLRHAHGLRSQGRPLGVIHRDIAPHNVLVSESGEVKLSDFGIARVCGELSSGEHIKGRTRYMAPEQLRGEPTQASDLYAVGAILHELLEGRRFREGLERGPWHEIVSQAQIIPLQRAQVPAPLEALRVGLLQPDPRFRIPNAEEALRRLSHCPPWTAGADSLRRRYQECIDVPRRTGLTRPVQALRPAVNTIAPTRRVTAVPRPADSSSNNSASNTATMRRQTGPTPAASGSSTTIRHRRTARTPRLRWSLPHIAATRVHRGLWGLAAGLATLAAGLAIGRVEPPACIREAALDSPTWAHVRVRGDDQPSAQLRIDMQLVDPRHRRVCRLSPGVHDLAWRASPDEPWSNVGPRAVAPAKEHLVRLSEDGLAITKYDP